MLPTPPAGHWGRYGHYHPDPHSFLGRAPPSTFAGAGAAEAAAAGAAAAAPHPAPMSWHHYYYGRGMRRGLGFRRFIWFGLGVAAATWYFRSKERVGRYELDHGSSSTHGAPPCGPGWGWSARRDLPSPAPPAPVMQAASPAVAAVAPQPMATPFSSQEQPAKSEIASEARRGWGHRWHRHTRDTASAGPSTPAAAPGVTVDPSLSSNADDLQKLKQVVERLWMEKKTEATAAQERANEKAREYASEKLDKLAAALQTLRETLRSDAPKSEKKVV